MRLPASVCGWILCVCVLTHIPLPLGKGRPALCVLCTILVEKSNSLIYIKFTINVQSSKVGDE
jgi:hypothetical protein